jgi:hypothetical protein
MTLTLAACALTTDLTHLADGPSDADAASPDAGPMLTPPANTDASDDGSPPATAGLVGHWRLDDASGTVAVDSSALRHDGVVIGGAKWAPKDSSQPGALSFDGADAYVQIAGDVAYATQHAPFSFSAWFDLLDFSPDPYPDIMAFRADGDTPWHVLLSTDPGFLGISLGSGQDWATIKTGVLPTLGVWHHVAVVYNGLGPSDVQNFEIVLDGVAQPLLEAGSYGTQRNESRIGASAAGNFFNGLIRDVRIYGRALSRDEVGSLFAGR